MSLRLGGAITDRINIGSGVSIDNLNPMTILAWVYPTTLTTNRTIYFKGPSGSSRRLLRLADTAGNIQYAVIRASLTNYVTNSAPLANLDRWYLVAATFDSTAAAGEIVNIYVGTEKALASEATYGTATDGSGAVTDDAADDAIWGNVATLDLSWQGLLGYGAVFNLVLPPAEIHRWQGRSAPRAGCRDFHKFGGVLGAGRQLDESGYGNHGVVTGAVPSFLMPRLSGNLSELSIPASLTKSWLNSRAEVFQQPRPVSYR